MKKILWLVVLFGIILTGCGAKSELPQNHTSNPQTEAKPSTSMTVEQQLPELTLEELRRYDGSNGKVYIGYKGKVYDVTNFKAFFDMPHTLLHGKDVTPIMGLSPHGDGVLRSSSVKVVGRLVN